MTTTPHAAVEAFLARHPGLTWEHRPELGIDRIDLVASMTNQVRHEPIDGPTVERYAAALADGDTFPPIIVRAIGKAGRRCVVLGGNHRTRAHLDAGRTTIDAYVVTCDERTALEVAYGDNATHGLPPTDAERVAHALRLVEMGRTPAEAARTVGLGVATVYRRQRRDSALARATRLQVAPELVAIIATVQEKLDGIGDDRVFVAVTKALAVHRFTQAEAYRLIGDINAQGNVKDQLDLLAANVAHHRDAAKIGRGTGRPPTNPYLMLRTALGTVRGLHPSDVLEACLSVRERDELARSCMDGARHLKAIHDLARLADSDVA